MLDPNTQFNKEQFLDNLAFALQTNIVSKAEILQAVKNSGNNDDSSKLIIKLFAILGSIIAILGIVFFAALFWSNIGSFGQILITLGVGLSAFGSGILLILRNAPKFVSLSVHLIGIVLIPNGIFVALSKLPTSSIPNSLMVFLVFASLAAVYLLTDLKLKSKLFTTATYLFSSISYFALVSLFFEQVNIEDGFRIFYTFMLVYALPLIGLPRVLAPGFRSKTYSFFEGLGYFILFSSVFGILLYTLFEILAILVYISGVFLGSYLKSKTIIVHSFIAITLFILYINFRYFADVISWPLALIFSGFILILSSYLFTKIREGVFANTKNSEPPQV